MGSPSSLFVSFPEPVHRLRAPELSLQPPLSIIIFPRSTSYCILTPNYSYGSDFGRRYGIRIRVAGMKILSPRPLDEPTINFQVTIKMYYPKKH